VTLRDLVTPLVLAAGALLVRGVQADLAARHAHLRETSDSYGLPPPEETVRLSLGYRAALADVLWMHVLVSQGEHMLERRRYENLTRLIDTINALDPSFRDPYLFADALVTFQAGDTPIEEIRKVREILELGVKNRPFDAEMWLTLGQFVRLVAPSYLTDPAEKEAWRRDAGPMLLRAAELSGDNASIAWQAIGGARAMERDAGIRFRKRVLAVTDDEELKERLTKEIAALEGEGEAESIRRREAAFRELWRRDVPFVERRGVVLILGPKRDPARCAGDGHETVPECALTWRDWAERLDPKGAARP
jgi:hypothetical protein